MPSAPSDIPSTKPSMKPTAIPSDPPTTSQPSKTPSTSPVTENRPEKPECAAKPANVCQYARLNTYPLREDNCCPGSKRCGDACIPEEACCEQVDPCCKDSSDINAIKAVCEPKRRICCGFLGHECTDCGCIRTRLQKCCEDGNPLPLDVCCPEDVLKTPCKDGKGCCANPSNSCTLCGCVSPGCKCCESNRQIVPINVCCPQDTKNSCFDGEGCCVLLETRCTGCGCIGNQLDCCPPYKLLTWHYTVPTGSDCFCGEDSDCEDVSQQCCRGSCIAKTDCCDDSDCGDGTGCRGSCIAKTDCCYDSNCLLTGDMKCCEGSCIEKNMCCKARECALFRDDLRCCKEGYCWQCCVDEDSHCSDKEECCTTSPGLTQEAGYCYKRWMGGVCYKMASSAPLMRMKRQNSPHADVIKMANQLGSVPQTWKEEDFVPGNEIVPPLAWKPREHHAIATLTAVPADHIIAWSTLVVRIRMEEASSMFVLLILEWQSDDNQDVCSLAIYDLPVPKTVVR